MLRRLRHAWLALRGHQTYRQFTLKTDSTCQITADVDYDRDDGVIVLRIIRVEHTEKCAHS